MFVILSAQVGYFSHKLPEVDIYNLLVTVVFLWLHEACGNNKKSAY